MKKITALILAFAMLISLCACGGGEAPEAAQKGSEQNETSSQKENDGNVSGLEVDEKLFNVDVTIPASFFDEEQTAEEIIANAEEQGIKNCTVNDDGSVCYTMSKAKHAELLEELYGEAEKTFTDMLEGESAVASFEDIAYNENLSEITVTVNEQYAVWDMFNGFAFYILGSYYQIFGGADPDSVDVVVNFVDAEGNLKDTMSYREFMNNAAESAEEPTE